VAHVAPRAMIDVMNKLRTDSADRRAGLTLAGAYCVFAGVSEIWVGITGNWLGILSTPLKPSFWTALVGACYVAAGISLLSKRRTGLLLGMVFILLEVVGRVCLVRIGTYPSKGPDVIKSVVGGGIALSVAAYVANQWRKFAAARA
jgi:hydrogenase/urease accessory protein HupE